MKRIHKLFSIFLALALAVSLLPQIALQASADASGSCGDKLTWTYSSETNTLTISGSGEMEDFHDYNSAPWFRFYETISSIQLPVGLKTIGSYAFYCNNVTSVTIPDGVTSIGFAAFCGCSSLVSVKIGNSVTSISESAFRGCTSLTSVTIPDSVTSIGDSAFCGCTSLTSVNISESMTSIGNAVFEDCTSLASVTIPDSVTSIGGETFHGCSSLASVNIPDRVTSIGYEAFAGTVIYNNKDAWQDGLLYVGRWLIRADGDIKTASVKEGTVGIAQAAFYECSSLASVTIPDGVTSIPDSAFMECSDLTSVTIPDSVTSISSGAFCGCESLASVRIPDRVTSIGDWAFARCSCLISVRIPDGVTSIGGSAFSYSSNLSSVNIPDSVTSVGSSAFHDTAIYNNKSAWQDGVLYIGHWLIAAEGIQTATVKEGTLGIADFAIASCSALTSVTIPGSVKNIGTCAFSGCRSLANITIPDGVTSIGVEAFRYCESLASITIPDSMTSIEDGAFYKCSSLNSVTIPHSMTSIGNDVFSQCTSLASVTIPDSVTSIGKSAFYKCTSLNSVRIPNSVTSIGKWGFYDCTSLKSVTVPDSVTKIGKLAFGFWHDEKEDGDRIVPGFRLYGGQGSAAEKYASENGIPFSVGSVEPAVTFTDVSPTAYYAEAVSWAVNHTPVVTKGVSATEFGPAQDCNRGQVVTFLWRAAGEPEPTSSVNPFVDVAEKDYYYKAVLWAVEKNVTKGMDDTHFGPKQTCTRGQVVTFLWRAKGEPAPTKTDNPFVDVAEKDFYFNAILWAVEKGVTKGTSATEFSPKQTCTRGQVVTFLYRAFGSK